MVPSGGGAVLPGVFGVNAKSEIVSGKSFDVTQNKIFTCKTTARRVIIKLLSL